MATAKPERPRLKKGESPQDASFKKRQREYLRQLAIIEATEAQAKIRAEEEAANAKRDVLKESESKPKPAKKDAPKKDVPTSDDPKDDGAVAAVRKRLQATRAGGLKNRIDDALEAIQSGVDEADAAADDKDKRKKK